MEVKFEKTGNVNAEITITINKEDYAERVDKALKDYRKKANVPGFRPGQAPMGMLKKRFGTEITVDEVNKLLGEKLYAYIRENDVNILGEPLPSEEKNKDIDFVNQENFTFVFDVALAPEFSAKLTKKDKVDFYTIAVSDEMIDQQVQMYASRAGEYKKVDEYQAKDMVKGTLRQLENGEVKAEGVVAESAVMLPEYMKNDDEKAKFEGKKVGETIVFNPAVAYDNNETELSSLLKIQKDQLADAAGDYQFEITEITRFTPAELTQELFDQVLGKDKVKSEEEFRAALKEDMQKQFKNDSLFKFMIDLRKHLTKRVGELEFPEAMLKRIMRLNNQDKDEQFIEDNFEGSKNELVWHLIKEQLSDQFKVKVEQDDILETAKKMTRIQFAQYGMNNVPDEMLAQYAQEMLKNKQQAENLVYRTVEDKIAEAAVGAVKLNEKEVSLEEFNKMFQTEEEK